MINHFNHSKISQLEYIKLKKYVIKNIFLNMIKKYFLIIIDISNIVNSS